MIKTHKSLKTLKSEESLKPWLFQIANRTIIDFYRANATKQEITADSLWYDQDEPYDNELAQCILPFIRCLPEKYARVLTEIEINGQSQKAYAEANGVAYSTLKSQVQKGRLELKKLFDRCCEIQLDARGNAMGCDDSVKRCQC